LTSGRRPVVKIIAESLSQHDEKHVVPTSHSGIRIGNNDDKDENKICMLKNVDKV
jgi:hypothetical protein